MRPLLAAFAAIACVAAAPATEINRVDLTQDLMALGTEPFWEVSVTPQELKFTRMDWPDRTGPNNGPTISGGRAVWTTVVNDGKRLTLTVTTGPCSDGMSDREYPLTARLELTGFDPMEGCAATIAALERAGDQGEVR